ncbi:MAG: hypothetical protein AAFX06_27590 [Planctomycetota bacterium]
MNAKPDPEYQIDDRVSVIVNDRNKTARTGTIQGVVWHFKDSRYNYYLEVEGRSISKRYLAIDLLPAAETALPSDEPKLPSGSNLK